MKWRLSARLAAGLVTALVWALAAGSALFWALRAGDGRAPVGAPLADAAAADAGAVDAAAVARVLGASGAAAPAASADVASRLALRGIVTHGGHGAALIAVDGKPAKPVRVGAALPGLEGDWKVQSVTPRAVVLRARDQQVRLEMPLLSARSNASDAVAPAIAANVPAPAMAPATGSAPAGRGQFMRFRGQQN